MEKWRGGWMDVIFKLAHWIFGDPEEIVQNILTIIIISDASTFHILDIFPRLCAWGGCSIICWRFRIYPGEPGILFQLFLCSLMICADNRVHHDPVIVLLYLHITLLNYQHYAHVSEGIELDASQVYYVEQACLRFREVSETYFIENNK